MEQTLLLLLFFVLVGYLIMDTMKKDKVYPPPIKDTPSHSKPEHVLHNVLQEFSKGDKVTLKGNCKVNLYTRNTITVDMKKRFTKLLNEILQSIYGLTHHIYDVQELNNIYEKLDESNNARYIIDATINSKNNYYTVNIVVDVVIINGEVLVNAVIPKQSSNNNILNRYDIVFNDQGILLDQNNFTSNVSSILDTKYKETHKLIEVDTERLDDTNYPLDNVLSLTSMLNSYYPATTSSGTINNFKEKGIDGLLERYFPSDLVTVESPLYCDEVTSGFECVFKHNSNISEFTQPYMAPGLFFDRSSFPKQ